MTNARAVYDSIIGKIISQWEIFGDQLTIHVEIPFNTEATIILPTGQLEKIIESPQECTFKKEGICIGCNVRCPWSELLANGINHLGVEGHEVYAITLMKLME